MAYAQGNGRPGQPDWVLAVNCTMVAPPGRAETQAGRAWLDSQALDYSIWLWTKLKSIPKSDSVVLGWSWAGARPEHTQKLSA